MNKYIFLVIVAVCLVSCDTLMSKPEPKPHVETIKSGNEDIKKAAEDTKTQTSSIKGKLDEANNKLVEPEVIKIESNQNEIIKAATTSSVTAKKVEEEINKINDEKKELQEKLDSPLRTKIEWGMIISFIIIAAGGAMMSPFIGMFKQGLTTISVGTALLVTCYYVQWIIDLMPWIVLTITCGIIALATINIKKYKDQQNKDKEESEKVVDELVESFELAKKLVPPDVREKLTGGVDGVSNGEVGRIQSEKTKKVVIASRKKQKDKWTPIV